MHPQVALGNVAAAAAHLVHLAVAPLGSAINPRADTRAVGFHSDRLYLKPVRSGRLVATQELRHIVDTVDKNIDVAVIVEVAKGTPASGHFFQDSRPAIQRDVGELSVPQITIYYLALSITRLGIGLGHLRINVAIADENIGPAIVVEIDEARAPTAKACISAQSRLKGCVLEDHFTQVPIEAGSVAGEIRLHDIEVTIAVKIDRRAAHPGLRLAVRAIGDPRFDGNIREGPIVIVFVHCRGGRVVRNIDVGPAVVVEIGHQHAKPIGSWRIEDSGLFRNVGKCSITVVVKKDVLPPLQAGRAAGNRKALIKTRTGLRQSSGPGIEVDVVGYKKIDLTVAIVIDERTARVPALTSACTACGDPGLPGPICKFPVAIVVPQNTVTPIGDEKVVPPIVIVISRADPLTPTRTRNA